MWELLVGKGIVVGYGIIVRDEGVGWILMLERKCCG